jgi:uncharacterized protein (TIGR03437 family)
MRAQRIGTVVRFAWAFVLLPWLAQAQPVTVGAGYTLPRLIEVAPGQVITLFVRVPGKTPAASVTAQPPLPSTLAGFSIVLRQSFPTDPVPVPIQSVVDSQFCSEVAPPQCDVVSLLTVQVPFELTPNVPRSRMPENSARLDVTYNNVAATSLFLKPVSDYIHVLNTCDIMTTSPDANCAPVVMHPDGSVVDIEHPAAPGERLTVALAGMGLLSQLVTTGGAAPAPAPAVDNVWVRLDFRANQAPVRPDPDADSSATARLRSGAVGIYDVLFTVPNLPDGTPACSSDLRSNLTVSIGRTVSYDGAAICVAVPAP